MWQFYYWCTHKMITSNLWTDLRNELLDKIIYKPNKKENVVVIHIRRGDLNKEPLSYSYNVLHKIYDESDFQIKKIIVVSFGTDNQKNEIINTFKEFEDIQLEFNTDTIESFKYFLDAHILITASSLSKLGGYYSNGIKIHLPYFEYNRKSYKKNMPNIPEHYGDSWISADIQGNFDIEHLQRLLHV